MPRLHEPVTQGGLMLVHIHAAILASIAVVLHLLAANYHWRKWHEL